MSMNDIYTKLMENMTFTKQDPIQFEVEVATLKINKQTKKN